MLKTLHVCALFLLFNAATYAQLPADSVLKRSPVRTLTHQEYEAYLKGEPSDEFALVAAINHYPMPDKVLKLKVELDLSPIQVKKLTEVNTYMHRRSLDAGESIIKNERVLDSLFRVHALQDGILIFYVNRYGMYKAALRNAILQGCLSAQQLLSPQQIERYESLQKSKHRYAN